MRAEWTPAVARAVDAAQAWAVRLNADVCGPLHLLLGLLDEEEGRAADLLRQGGLTIAAARGRLHEWPRDAPADRWEPIFSTALELAVERSGDPFVGTDHVLLALLLHETALRSHLEAAGLNVAHLDTAEHAVPPTALKLDGPLDLSEPAGDIETARILDAAANRAREALRVIEDYCRFALDDAFLCREIKTLRHDLAEALESAGSLPLLAARDTLGDVGTAIDTPRESQRESPRQVVQVNLKRLQESLRSLEEYGKVIQRDLGASLERLRYRAYTLERTIILGTDARQRLADARLYLLVTGSHCATSLEFLIEEAAAGGVDMIQLREKEMADRDFLERARNVRRWTRKAGVLFVVNDRPDIARLVEADAVHLGQDDLAVREARRILGADALIGVSTHNLEQVRGAIRDGASYLGVGPVFPSATKAFGAFPGPDFVQEAMRETTLPAFALGGITARNLPEVIAAGATRVAVSAAVCGADEPRPIAHLLRGMLDKKTNHRVTENREKDNTERQTS